jgi:hypothetical protein
VIRDTFGPAAAIALAILAVAPAGAHHSIAKFDGRRVVRISGVVTDFRWVNPHAFIAFDSRGTESAGAGHWIVEMQAPTTMMGEGWGRDSLSTGDQIIVFANPLREVDPSAASHRGLYVGIILPDGRMLGRVEQQDAKGDN